MAALGGRAPVLEKCIFSVIIYIISKKKVNNSILAPPPQKKLNTRAATDHITIIYNINLWFIETVLAYIINSLILMYFM